MNALYSSQFNIVGNCGGVGTGLTAVQLNRCNMCRGFIAVGQGNTGLALANYSDANVFTVDIEVLTTGIVQQDSTCSYNEILSGVIANTQNAIDNHLGGPLRIRNTIIGGNTNIFANPTATNSTWGGYAVTVDDAGQNLTNFTPGLISPPNVWVLNKSAQPQWISFFGNSDADPTFSVSVRNWYDFSSAGITVAKKSPCGFVLAPGEQISYQGVGTYTWNWRPLF